MSRGCVPGEPFARVIQDWLQKHELTEFAGLMELDLSAASKLANGKRPWIGFDIADRIICVIGPELRLKNPEIKRIFREFDLEWLDRVRPCAA